MRRLWQAMARRALPLVMAHMDRYQRAPLLAAAADPEATQLRLLFDILRANAKTEFGRRHGFAGITDWQSFRAAVPVQTHESLLLAIDRQATTGSAVLTTDPPLWYARTSGTTGQPKDIPVTRQTAALNRDAQRQTALTLQRQTRFFDGEILAFSSPAVEGRRDDGAVYGSATGHAYAKTSALIRSLFVLPHGVYAIPDYDLKSYVAALLGLGARRLTGLVAANPSTLLKLIDTIENQRRGLLADLGGGPAAFLDRLDPPVRGAVARRLRAAAPPSDRLRCLLAGDDPIRLADLWPDLGAVLTWTGGSCGIAVDALRPHLPGDCRIVEVGYRASEVTATVSIDTDDDGCLPMLRHVVFEFVERGAWERGEPAFRCLGQLAAGRQYYVFVTTAAGLYRYDMNDVVRVTGWTGSTPMLAFVRKGRGVTNITGEKLTEADVIAAVTQALSDIGQRSPFFVALADALVRRYDLLLETDGSLGADRIQRLAKAVDDGLRRRNLEYDAKRASGRLEPLQVVPMRPGAGEHCKRAALRRGQREAQYKPVCLADRADWPVDLSAYVETEDRRCATAR